MNQPTRTETERTSFEDVKGQAANVGEEVKNLGSVGRDYARARAEEAADRGRSARDSAVDSARSFEDDVVRYVREQPLKSIAIAAGVGAIAALWLRR